MGVACLLALAALAVGSLAQAGDQKHICVLVHGLHGEERGIWLVYLQLMLLCDVL